MKMTSEENVVKFSNGVSSPQIHFGTYRIKTAEDVRTAVSTALEVGYRAFDTASVYKNHRKIAETFKEFLPKLGLSRKDIFLTSKLAPKDHGEQKCEDAIKNILTDLDTDYLDLFLIHWPGVQKLDVRDPENRVLRAQSWRVLERQTCERCLMRVNTLELVRGDYYILVKMKVLNFLVETICRLPNIVKHRSHVWLGTTSWGHSVPSACLTTLRATWRSCWRSAARRRRCCRRSCTPTTPSQR